MVVTLEDCVTREPRHIPEPTEEELALEMDWEDKPQEYLDLIKLAEKKGDREEMICEVGEGILNQMAPLYQLLLSEI